MTEKRTTRPLAGRDDDLPLSALPSLGPTSARLLAEVGIQDLQTLKQHGALGSFTVLRMRFGKRITVNWIYALECALRGIDWRLLEAERKDRLRMAARKVITELESTL